MTSRDLDTSRGDPADGSAHRSAPPPNQTRDKQSAASDAAAQPTTSERGLRDLTWTDWRSVFVRAAFDMNDDAAPLLSAGVAFYMFLSFFPGLLAVLTIYGLLADAGQLEHQLTSVLTAMPGDARAIVVERLHALADQHQGLSLHLVLAVIGALWTSSLGVTGLLKAVKIAYDEEEHRNFLELRWTGILLTFGALGFLMAAVGLLAIVPVVLDSVGLDGATRVLVEVLRWGIVVLLAITALTLVYHLGADRAGAHPKWTGPGTLVAATIWTLISALFSWYAGTIGHYTETYGTIAGGTVLLLWLFLTNLTILFGAEINAEAERQARGQVRPRLKEAPWHTALVWWRSFRRAHVR